MTILALCLYLPTLSASQTQLVSTESDPDAFIQNSVNVINGDYCEATTDLVITGPDALVLQRFYSTKDAMTGRQAGGWRMFPQREELTPLMIGQMLEPDYFLLTQEILPSGNQLFFL